MFEALMMFIQRTFLRSKIKKITKTDNIKHAKDAVKRASGPIAESHKKEAFKKVKSMLFKDKALTWGIRVQIAVFLITVIIVIMIAFALLMVIGNLAGFSILGFRDTESMEEEDESGWEFVLDGEQDPSVDFSTGGVYPKDPELKQTAQFLELLNSCCELVNSEFGETRVSASSILSVFIRETGGRILNDIVKDTSINIYTDLVYQNPICGKGANCLWIQNGYSHFIGGTVSGNTDTGDPANMQINTSSDLYERFKTSDGHAIGYGQFEVIYVESYLDQVYPIGDYANKEYNNSTDRYKEDSQLGFIRPNVAYIPDILYSTAHSIGDALWSGGAAEWNNIKSESWFQSLSDEEKAFCYSSFRQMGYIGGYVDAETMQLVSGVLKMLWGLKQDGYIDSICNALPYLRSKYPNISSSIGKVYSNNIISRPSNKPITDLINAVLTDSSFGSNTTSAASELQSKLTSITGDSTFGYYTAGHYTWSRAVPGAIGWQLLAEEVVATAVENINAAEKEATSGSPSGAVGSNYLGYVGSGRFANPSSSEYYAPELQAVWFSQGRAGGNSVFGHTIPAYTTTIQNKKYMSKNYKAYGCPAYSMAMLLSNMLGTVIMPDQLPGTTTATLPWKTGSHSVSSSGLGFSTGPNSVIASVNQTLKEQNAGFTLKTKLLSTTQLANCEQYLYDWLDAGAMLWVRVIRYNSAYPTTGNHFVTICGYDRASKVGDNYDLRVLNSILGNSVYTLTNINNGQGVSAERLNEHPLHYYLRNYSTYCCLVVWRSDMAETLPGLG